LVVIETTLNDLIGNVEVIRQLFDDQISCEILFLLEFLNFHLPDFVLHSFSQNLSWNKYQSCETMSLPFQAAQIQIRESSHEALPFIHSSKRVFFEQFSV